MAGYESKHAGPDGLYSYSTEEDAVWGALFTRQIAFLEGRMAPAFLDGVKRLGLSAEHVPQVRDVNARLAALTGAGVEGVPAMGVAGRFYTDGTLAKNMPRALQIVDFLVAEVRAGR